MTVSDARGESSTVARDACPHGIGLPAPASAAYGTCPVDSSAAMCSRPWVISGSMPPKASAEVRIGGIGGTFSGWGSTQARRSPLPPETRRPSPLRPSLARQAPEPGGAPPAACARLSLLQKLLFHHRGGTKASFHQGPESAISGQKGDTDHKHSQGSGGLRPLRGPVAPCALTDHISVRRVRQPQTMRVRCSVVGTQRDVVGIGAARRDQRLRRTWRPVLLCFPREHPERGAAFPAMRGNEDARGPANV
jgi:hypothetical protein